MYANRYSLRLFGMLGAVFFAAAPASAQCTDQWLPGEDLPGLDDDVLAAVVHDDGSGPALYVGGDFTTAGGTPANHIARWDGTNWSPLGSGMDGFHVIALTVYNGQLIAGGLFTTAGGTPAQNIARWDGTSWSPLGSGVNHFVASLTVYNGQLIAGGNFVGAGGTPAQHIARWDGASWSPLGSGVSDSVYALTVYNRGLIAGGGFQRAGGKDASAIARWDGTRWSPLGGGVQVECWYCLGPSVRALGVYNEELIAGGESFTIAGETRADKIARWNGKFWSPLGSGLECDSCVDPYVWALTVYNGELIAGGAFPSAGGTPANSIARWNGESWSPLGSGITGGSVWALTVYNGELIVGGAFSGAGGMPVNHIAHWGPDVPRGDLDGDCSVGYADLDILLDNWGPCADCDDCPADLDADCTVGVVDLLILLGNWR